MIHRFDFVSSRIPAVVAGPGAIRSLPERLSRLGFRRVVLVAAPSFLESGRALELSVAMTAAGLAWRDTVRVHGEPTTEVADRVAAALSLHGADAVVAAGGGSTLDAAKAACAASAQGCRAGDLVEGIGRTAPDGRILPWFAIPTTAGTGSEATWNAVLSGGPGTTFKKSLRHPSYPSTLAVLDPEATATCPATASLACALDALAQLIEPFTGTESNAFSDAWCEAGLKAARDSLAAVSRYARTGEAPDGRERAAGLWAAFCSGVSLAHAGVGIAHGMAGPLGARLPVPHGVAVGLLLPLAVRHVLARSSTVPDEAFHRFARVARALGLADSATPPLEAVEALAQATEAWSSPLPRLSEWSPPSALLDAVAAEASPRAAAVELSPKEARAILDACL